MEGAEQPAGAQKRLRKSCDFCLKQKVKCDGYDPCGACERRQRSCTYSEKPSAAKAATGAAAGSVTELKASEEQKRKAPASSRKRSRTSRTADARENESQSDAGASGSPQPAAQVPRELVAVGQTIGKQELHFLKVYNMFANPVRPFLTKQMVKQGLEFHRTAAQKDLPARHAAFPSVAAVWAAIAYGASLVHDSRTAVYAECARSALQFCFDVATPETIRAYLLVEAWNTVSAPPEESTASFTMFKFAETLWDELRFRQADPAIEAFINSCRVHYALANGFLGNFLHRDEMLVAKIRFPEQEAMESVPLSLRLLYETDAWLYNTMLFFMVTNHQQPSYDMLQAQYCKFSRLRMELMSEGGWQANAPMMLMLNAILACTLIFMHRTEEGIELALEMAQQVQQRPIIISRSHIWHVMHVATIVLANNGQERVARRLQRILEPGGPVFLGTSDVTLLAGAHPLAKIVIHAILAQRLYSGPEQQSRLASLVEGLEANYAVAARSAVGAYQGHEESEDATSIESAIQYLEDYHSATHPHFSA